MDILARTWRALEWERLKEHLAAEAETAWGRELCLSLQPHRESRLIELLLDETSEGASLLEGRSPLPLEAVPDLREVDQRLRASADLAPAELLDVKTVLLTARHTRGSLKLLESTTFPRLASYIDGLHSLEPLVEAIDQAIDDHAQVKDTASENLAQLRREVKAIDSRIRDVLGKLIHSPALGKALQEPLYTQRNGRYVLPIHAGMTNALQGIVHDSSASGLTVYVEPMPVVELSNKMRLKEGAVDQEIARILGALSRSASTQIEKIESSFRTLVELDFIIARSRLALKYGGTRPEIAGDGRMRLRAARHPLLVLKKDLGRAPVVVPNDITLNQNQRTIVVTGPNTGGKTVLLKTAGLLSLMVRAGLLIPVASGSSAVIFSEIFADIGDEQSIEQSLSTFSSHMTNIVQVTNRADRGSLVLLDEIGAGTDPREGAALARAVLEHLNSSGAYTITATHYGELKALAHTCPGFVNASLEFGEIELSPTYRLRIGLPGSSKATTIAQRLGLKTELVREAELLLQSGARDVDEMMSTLEKKLEDLAAAELKLKESMARTRELEDRADSELARLQQEQERLRGTYAAEIEMELKTAKELIRALISQLQKTPSIRRAQEAQNQLETLKKELGWLEPRKISGKGSGSELKVGQTVRVLSLNKTATVEAVPANLEQDAPVTVRVGALKVKVSRSDLEPVESGSAPKSERKRSKADPASGGGRPRGRAGADHASLTVQESEHGSVVFVRTESNTLDLRGHRVDEALAKLERFLDQSVLSTSGPVMIIHGHGTGAVKSAVRGYLRGSNYATTFRPGEIYEGGDGVTVVDLS